MADVREGTVRVAPPSGRPGDLGAVPMAVRQDDAGPLKDDAAVEIPDGAYVGLQVDDKGYLRVVARDGATAAQSESLSDKLDEIASLLRRLVLAAELIHETSIPDEG